jgi:4-amino-4-deoxy-L-arabinose transferase-like glycosyltransferase
VSSTHSTSIAHSEPSGIGASDADENSTGKSVVRYGFAGAVLVGIALRLLVVILGGNGIRTPWGGGGDTPTYVLLAQNLLAGKGYTYAGVPSAFRPPGYPILLAASLKIFGSDALAAVRWLQFFEGLAVAFLCAALAGRIYGKEAEKAALAIALFFPTLVEMNGEILTEATATLFTAIFLYLLVRYIERPNWTALTGLALTMGIGILTRFNMVLLVLIVLAVMFFWEKGLPKWRSAAIVTCLPLLVISPWLVRNLVVFHGAVLLSTGSGINAIQGIVTPQGRALPGDSDRLRAAVGWVPPVQIETNSPSRYELPGEPALDQQCWRATIAIWRATGWGLVPLALKKLSYFWLSTDQLLWTGAFSPRQRLARATGVIGYLLLLSLGLVGWFRLRAVRPMLARIFLLYAVAVTLFHLPFNMITRYRMPFIDPLIAVLAGIGVVALVSGASADSGKALLKDV